VSREPERLHTAVLVGPNGERRRTKKARRRAAATILAEEKKSRLAEAKAKCAAEKTEQRATTYLPTAGEPGPAALRSPHRFRLPRHQDTSATLAGAYPFLAEGGLGSQGVFVGQDLYSGGSFVYDPWVLYQRGVITAPNIVLAGIVGSGKSSLAKSLYTRSIPFGRRVYVPGDPKGEHTPVALAVGGKAIVLGHGLANRLNPLDEGHRTTGLSDAEWSTTVTSRRRDLIGALAETVLDRGLSPLEHTAIDLALADAVRSAEVPILPMVVERILTPSTADDADGRLAEDGRHVGHALRRLVAGDLQGLFDGPSTVRFDPSLPMVSLDLSRVAENSKLISVLMTCSSAWMESALLDPAGGQRWVVYDEAWRLMSHPALLKRMDAQWRLARHYGIANMLIFHKLSDLDNVGDQGTAMRALAGSLLANAETRIIYRQESDQLGATAAALGLTRTEQKLLPGLGTGQGLWRIKDRSFVIQHQLHPAELETFDTRARMRIAPKTGSRLMSIPRPRSKHHDPAHDTGDDGSAAPIPVSLPHVIITVSQDDELTVTVAGDSFAPPTGQGPWRRSAFGTILDGLIEQQRCAMRVEVHEADGTTFTDILTPPARRTGTPEAPPPTEQAAPVLVALHGAGFIPGEDVAVAIVVSHSDAAPDGTAHALIPTALMSHSPTDEIVLLGRISGTVTVGHPQ